MGDTGRLTGGYRYNGRVVGGLRVRGVEVDEVVPCGASPEEQEAFGADPLPDHHRYDVIVVDALARVVASPHLDRWRSDRPVLAVVHELQSVAGPPENARREEAHERPLLRSDRLVAVSGHGASILEARGVPAERVRILPPGADGQGRGDDTARTGGSSPPRVLCVAQWIPRKGILDLVRAWTRLGSKDAVLDLVGETDADPVYAARVREVVGGDPTVLIRGAVDDAEVRSAYRAADVFALPSRYEGYGIVYAEALAHGLPVIACDAGPVPELVGEEAALLALPGDVEVLSGALDLLLEDAALRGRMSAAARRRAKGLPRWEDTTVGFLRILREAVSRRCC